eukprot:m.469038 g.469038  ORF g.469038 m.469038 type:complete len:66 (+) comp57087_c0_seq18:588-785(+)
MIGGAMFLIIGVGCIIDVWQMFCDVAVHYVMCLRNYSRACLRLSLFLLHFEPVGLAYDAKCNHAV